MADYWGTTSSGIWNTTSSGGWLIQLQVPATTCGLTTLQAVKDYLGITDSTNDAWLQMEIDYLSAYAQNYCERYFCAGDFTQTWKRPIDTGLVWGGKALYLGSYPVNSVASVTVNGTLLTADQFTVDKLIGQLVSTEFLTGYDIEAVFNAGYATIPVDLSHTITQLVAGKYIVKGGDPTQIIRSESVPEVGSVDYVASTYQRGQSGIWHHFQEILDSYRSERHFEYDASL